VNMAILTIKFLMLRGYIIGGVGRNMKLRKRMRMKDEIKVPTRSGKTNKAGAVGCAMV
jgi:hypothetical protein